MSARLLAPRDASWWKRPRRKGVYTVHAFNDDGMAVCRTGWHGIMCDTKAAAPVEFWGPGQVCQSRACRKAIRSAGEGSE